VLLTGDHAALRGGDGERGDSEDTSEWKHFTACAGFLCSPPSQTQYFQQRVGRVRWRVLDKRRHWVLQFTQRRWGRWARLARGCSGWAGMLRLRGAPRSGSSLAAGPRRRGIGKEGSAALLSAGSLDLGGVWESWVSSGKGEEGNPCAARRGSSAPRAAAQHVLELCVPMRGGWWLLPGSRFAPPLPLPVRLAVLSVAAGIFLWSDPARFRGHEHCPASLRFGVLPFLDQPSTAIRELQRAPVL